MCTTTRHPIATTGSDLDPEVLRTVPAYAESITLKRPWGLYDHWDVGLVQSESKSYPGSRIRVTDLPRTRRSLAMISPQGIAAYSAYCDLGALGCPTLHMATNPKISELRS